MRKRRAEFGGLGGAHEFFEVRFAQRGIAFFHRALVGDGVGLHVFDRRRVALAVVDVE